MTVAGQRLMGFEAFMDWYSRRRAVEGPDFSYVVDDLLSGSDHAAALLTLRNGQRSWRQLGVFTVLDGMITEVWAAEDDDATDR